MTSKKSRPYNACGTITIDGKDYIYQNDDTPSLAYSYHDLSFVAQPLYGPEVNKLHNIVPVPLMMTDEWPVLISFTDVCKLPEPEYDFGFIGQSKYCNRSILKDLYKYNELDNYLFEDTAPIYDLNREEKREKIKSFLLATASCKFTFCPRGVGSSSFRLYQSLMMGSVPIVTDMMDYPFSDEVDWDKFVIRGKLKDIRKLIDKAKSLSDGQRLSMRAEGISFWNNYCKHDVLYDRLVNIARKFND